MRKGMGKGKGKGYKNLVGVDSRIHSMSAKGVKQPQKLNLYQQAVIKAKENFNQEFILNDGGVIDLKKGNFQNFGVFSNRNKYDSKEFATLKEAQEYINEIKRKEALDSDIPYQIQELKKKGYDLEKASEVVAELNNSNINYVSEKYLESQIGTKKIQKDEVDNIINKKIEALNKLIPFEGGNRRFTYSSKTKDPVLNTRASKEEASMLILKLTGKEQIEYDNSLSVAGAKIHYGEIERYPVKFVYRKGYLTIISK